VVVVGAQITEMTMPPVFVLPAQPRGVLPSTPALGRERTTRALLAVASTPPPIATSLPVHEATALSTEPSVNSCVLT
jgi:hypothetical protein